MTNYQNSQWGKLFSKAALLLLCTPAFLHDFCQKIVIVLVKSKLNKNRYATSKKMSPHCAPSETAEIMKNTPLCTVFIDLLSFEVSFTLIGVLFYFLSFPQLSSSLQTNIARRTNNLSLAEMSFSLLRPIMFFGIWNNAAMHSCARAREP